MPENTENDQGERSQHELKTLASANRKGWLRLAAFSLAGLLILGYSARWLHHRWIHVYEVDARVEANTMLMVSSRLPGWVTHFEISEADILAPGDLIAQIDNRDSSLAYEVSQAHQATLKESISRLEINIDLTSKQNQALYEISEAGVSSAGANLNEARIQRNQAKDDYERAHSLVAENLVTEQHFDHAKTKYEQAKQKYQSAMANHASAKARLEASRARLQQTEVMMKALAMLHGEMAQLIGEMKRKELDVNDRRLKSPVNAIVDRTFIDEGEYVSPGQNIALIHDPDSTYIEAKIKETAVTKVKIGQSVKITVDAYPGEVFYGEVYLIGQAATNQFALLPNPNPSGNFTKITQRIPVRISLPQPREQFKPGMMVEVSIDIRD